MVDEETLDIEYADHPPVTELVDIVTYCAEGVSLGFDQWEDPYVKGPGLYFVVVAGTSVDTYADRMGANRWPTDDCAVVDRDHDAFFETAQAVARECDGAVIVTVDGVIHEQMVRLKDLSSVSEVAGVDAIEYAEWMGARHMSALDTSVRDEVVAAVTLSEEDGRVTVFRNGDYTTTQQDELGGEWRVED